MVLNPLKHVRLWPCGLAVACAVLCVAPWAGAEEGAAVKKTPAPFYYQFFMKTDNFEVIPQEKERNDQIGQGELKPIHVGRPIEDFKLPDGFGNIVGLRDYVGKKNVFLSTMRTWW